MNKSMIYPIYRKNASRPNQLEIISENDIKELFEENMESEKIDVSYLGLFLMGPYGLTPLETITKTSIDEIYSITTQQGKQFSLTKNCKLGVYDPYNLVQNDINLVQIDKISVGDTIIGFAGQFNSILFEGEYIDLISEFITSSTREQLGHVSVVGIKEYLRAIRDSSDKFQDEMDLIAFSSLVDENGVFDEELDLLRLSTDSGEIKINSKLYVSEGLFDILGYFWKFGDYDRDIPIFYVPDYQTSVKVLKSIKKVFNSDTTIIPLSKNNFRISLMSPIYKMIFESIFGYIEGGEFHLPLNLFNSDIALKKAFIRSVIDDNVITTTSDHVSQELLFLLNSMNIFPDMEHGESSISIYLTENDLKNLRNEDFKDELLMDKINTIDRVVMSKPIVVYQVNSKYPYFFGPGLLINCEEVR